MHTDDPWWRIDSVAANATTADLFDNSASAPAASVPADATADGGYFVHFDPTQPSLTVSLSKFHMVAGDVFNASIVGGFVASVGDPYWGQDIFQNLSLVYNGQTLGDGDIQVVPGALTLEIVNNDSPLSDNADPNGDYGALFKPLLFSAYSETVDFGHLTYNQKAAIANGADLYDAEAGDDTVTMPNKSHAAAVGWTYGHTFDGGDGNDTLIGKGGDDLLHGGSGNDTIEGDGKAIAVYDGNVALGATPSDYTFTYEGGSTVQIAAQGTGEGTDTVSDVLGARFANNVVPLDSWHFDIERGQDGGEAAAGHPDTTISLSDNGVVKYSGQAYYDDTCPIASGTYDLIFRTHDLHGKNPVFEFADVDGTSTVPGRTAIEIHGGLGPAYSEGCIVTGIFAKMAAVLLADLNRLGTVEQQSSGRLFYNLPIPVTVTINDIDSPVVQPKVDFQAVSGAKNGQTITTHLDIDQAGFDPGLTKNLDVEFILKGVKSTDVALSGTELTSLGNGKWSMHIDSDEPTSNAISIKVLTAAKKNLQLVLANIDVGDDRDHNYEPPNRLLDGTNLTVQLNGGANGAVVSSVGRDHLVAGADATKFVYSGVDDSTSKAFDTVSAFDPALDKFALWFKVGGVDAAISGGDLRGSHFDADLAALADSAHLGAHHAVLIDPSAGRYAGETFLIVDANGEAGYQAGQDLVIRLDHGTDLAGLSVRNFV
jgi:hemolysin type calcium-binding protein